jgi:hypothetical protein
MSYWSDRAREVIAEVHAALPSDATFEDRKKALFDAYPFGERRYSPYKTWLSAQRAYLAQYDPSPAGTLLTTLTSPLDRAKARSERRALMARGASS